MQRLSTWKLTPLIGLALAALPAYAHFQLLVPDTDVVEAGDSQTMNLSVIFTHPMENGPAMEMGDAAQQFGVSVNGQRHDLSKGLRPKKVDGKTAYDCPVRVTSPGDYVFFIEPAPYWEPAEGKMIVHYTKVVVDVMGAEEGWDAQVGLPVEIEPLVRPYGLWTGNTFRGIVRRDGRPVPFAEIEVEYYNHDEKVKLPNNAFITQVIKADAAGTFSYTMPRAGWWGFAALVDGHQKMNNPDGLPVDVELGGLIWVKTEDMESK